jgi:hypothetical protein
MTFKIAAHNLEAHRQASADDLRRVFETVLCELHEADLNAKKKLQYRTPIVQRARHLGISQAAAERRALAEAARVLTQLWKV